MFHRSPPTTAQPAELANAIVAETNPGRRPLRVCTVAYTFYNSDARVMRYNVALAERGELVDVIALREPGQPKVISSGRVTVFGIQTRKVNEQSRFAYLFRNLLFFVRAMFLLSFRHLRKRYDVVHVHSVPDFLVFTAWLPKLTGAKVILDIHDLLPEFYASKFGVGHDSRIFRLLHWVERTSIAFADHLITANDLWQDKLTKRSVAPAKATAILNFPDRSVFCRRGRVRTDGKFVMIYPGSLNWHQGLDIAISAFAKVKDEFGDAEFHIYGVGPSLSALTKLVNSLGLQGRVLLKGRRRLHEIAEAIENADLGIVPKRKDGFGNEAFSTKILEFMALGVPVIVSDTKIDTYYFNDSLVKFFHGDSVDDLARCMGELMADREQRELLIRKGLQFVQSNCWDLKKKLYFDLVDSLLASPADRRPALAAIE